MTAQQAIDALNAAKPNDVAQQQKLDWLRELDLIITHELYGTHIAAQPDSTGEAYDANTVLAVSAPHDALYLPFLMAKVDFLNAEHDRFDNDVRVFKAALDTLSQHFNRTYAPRSAEVTW